jgi:hypothetical protein
MRPYLKKPFIKIGLVDWLKVKALSLSPSTAKKLITYFSKHLLLDNVTHSSDKRREKELTSRAPEAHSRELERGQEPQAASSSWLSLLSM